MAVSSELREPWVYTICGHVYSQHNWKAGPEESNKSRTCPLCRTISPYCKLELGVERGFFIDDGPLTHAFVPCGHVTSEKSTKLVDSHSHPPLNTHTHTHLDLES